MIVISRGLARSFRALARKNGFYTEIRQRMGDEAWTLLEKFIGKLG